MYVEKQTSQFIKILRIERSIEFTICNDFFYKHGIKHQFIVRYTSQYNDIVEEESHSIGYGEIN